MKHWLKFNTVGLAGVLVQLAVLWALVHLAGLGYVIATMLAVEVALLHNFLWHEAWTWRGMPPTEWPRRLLRFHLANGIVSIVSNAALTFVFRDAFGLPLLAANLLAIAVTSFLNFGLAKSWVFRHVAILLALAASLSAAVFTTRIQDSTAAVWQKYVERFESGDYSSRPMLDVPGDDPTLIDLNPEGNVPSGFIHHWSGAVRIPNSTVARVEHVLEDYDRYVQVYSPDVRAASASKTGAGAYDVNLVSERVEGVGLHFAFDIRSRVTFRKADGFAIVESRSYRIRESNSGHAPYTDLLPEGQDHGILWRLNSYWRLRQTGSSVYAECQVLSLSRRPLFGMRDLVQTRAKDSLAATLRATRNAAR